MMNYRNLYTVERFRPAQPALRPPNGSDEEPVEIHRYVDLKKTLEPLRYTIDGNVCTGRIYTCTGPTNAGKTTLWTMAALAVATGRPPLQSMQRARRSAPGRRRAS